MNPTAGSFNITPRMQRHFVTFAVQMPSAEIVRSIYIQIIDGHLGSFDSDVQKLPNKLVDASIELHRQVGVMGDGVFACGGGGRVFLLAGGEGVFACRGRGDAGSPTAVRWY